jgi:hypothetical protein
MGGLPQPLWSGHDSKLFFVQPDRKLMVAAFNSAVFSAGQLQVVAQTRITTAIFGWFQSTVALVGRILIDSFPSRTSSPHTLVTRWTARLRGL